VSSDRFAWRVTRLTGTGTASAATLALLVFGMVFGAVAFPRAALASRTTALRHTLSAVTPLGQAITASTSWDAVTSAMQAADNGAVSGGLTARQVSEVNSQLRAEFGGGAVRLAPAGEDWAGLTSTPRPVLTALPAAGGVPVRLEVSYRQPLLSHLRLVAGGFPAGPAAARPRSGTAGSATAATPSLQVLVSQATARQFGLHPGSRLSVTGPQLAATGTQSAITLGVTGIVAPRDPNSAFWQADPAVLRPDLQAPGKAPPFWVGAVFAGAGQIASVQRWLGSGLTMQWEQPVDFSALGGRQAQAYYDTLNRLATQTPVLTGDVAPVGATLQVSPGPLQAVAAFIAAASSVDVVLWLLYVSLAVTAVVVLLLTARMIAARRSAELTVRRARGASAAQVAGTAAFGAGLACGPAAVAGAVLAVLLVPGQEPAAGWLLAACTLAVAVAAPAALAAWQRRLPRRGLARRGAAGRGVPRARVRLAAEVTAAAAAVAGITVFRQQGTAPGAGVNLYTSAAPVLVAVPAVIVVLRLYPLALRGLLRERAQRRGAVAFLGLARAARVALTPALPAFALVLALTVAAFAGTVRDAITGGEAAASWQATGADVTISPVAASTAAGHAGRGISTAAQRAAAAVPGVTHATGTWETVWTTPDGQQLTVIAVDPAGYAALVAATQTFPAVQAAALQAAAPPRSGRPQPVLASPLAAAELGRGSQLISAPASVQPVRVQVAGGLSATPALPAGGAFVVLPLSALRLRPGVTGPLEPNELLLTGSGIDRARLASVVRAMMPGAVTAYRSDTFNALAGAPLQQGAFALLAVALVAAAVLGLAVVLLQVALGAAEREAALARLATMGLGERQRGWVMTWEVLPGVVAAAVAALACALLLPWVLRPAIDLSVFTGNASVTAPLTPSAASVLLPLAVLVAVTLAALAVEVWRGRRGVAARLRAGE
jgi:putative ABC transport system permease protein